MTTMKVVVEGDPDTFYNDRKKEVIELDVSIPYLSPDRKVTLQPTLHYAGSMREVTNKSILQFTTSRLHISGTEHANFSCRINEVSKRHGRQKFIIKFSPTCENEDISPGCTREILVKSRHPSCRKRSQREVDLGEGITELVALCSSQYCAEANRGVKRRIRNSIGLTMEKLKMIRWREMGTSEDGGPYYHMQNPNNLIDEIIAR